VSKVGDIAIITRCTYGIIIICKDSSLKRMLCETLKSLITAAV